MITVRATMAEAGGQIDDVREAVPGEVYLYFNEEGLLSRVLLIGVDDIETSEIEEGVVGDLDLALRATFRREWDGPQP